MGLIDVAGGSFRKVGSNPDVSLAPGNVVWPRSAAYVYPLVAAATTIVSGSANDTEGGSGARLMKVSGVGADFEFLSELVALDGLTPVVLSGEYLRLNTVRTINAGSNELNEGEIVIAQGANEIGVITVGAGALSQAIFTVPNQGQRETWILGFTGSISREVGSAIGAVELQLEVSMPGETAFSMIDVGEMSPAGGGFNYQYPTPEPVDIGADIRIRESFCAGTGLRVSASFDIAAVGAKGRLSS